MRINDEYINNLIYFYLELFELEHYFMYIKKLRLKYFLNFQFVI